ncbi:hypothetical protein FHS19_004566 [Paenibacillus rhizosphaerae]|uniref:Uncharacterized protein n=1 Tax=Paenibacillus rhizosphaerae TaxID=297318 RepID=A0A839TTI2_9BACL|nr:hypothetical protein [Paenibacillus rhizosphaerae]MBB3129861.1 hypothetical protein [Paenibacillus rhizosphaerae]
MSGNTHDTYITGFLCRYLRHVRAHEHKEAAANLLFEVAQEQEIDPRL